MSFICVNLAFSWQTRKIVITREETAKNHTKLRKNSWKKSPVSVCADAWDDDERYQHRSLCVVFGSSPRTSRVKRWNADCTYVYWMKFWFSSIAFRVKMEQGYLPSKYTVYTGPARPHICTCIPRATIIDLIYIFQCFNSADSIHMCFTPKCQNNNNYFILAYE